MLLATTPLSLLSQLTGSAMVSTALTLMHNKSRVFPDHLAEETLFQ
jgi:hypothetical protein